MTAYPAWTPASRPGIIPLHPLTFGTILGRSFSALRQNPRVLLGFALGVPAIAYVVVIVAVSAVAWASFSRLETLQPGTDDYEAVLAGSIAVTAVVGIVLGLAAAGLGVIVQGVVVAEVAHAAVAEKLTLGALWLWVRPIAWRLIGYALLVLIAVVVLVAAAGFAIFGLAAIAPPATAALGVIAVIGAIPLVWWLSVKLVLVPSVIILEQSTILGAIGRSWRLTRRRFWSTLGVILLLNLIFGAIAQAVSLPFSFLSAGLSTIIAPTSDTDITAIIALLVSGVIVQAVVLLIQAVAVVVQSTAAALIYIDCRMRHEGLDLDLLAYVERRDAGVTGLPDPYREHIGRVIAPRVPVPTYPAAYPAPYVDARGVPYPPAAYPAAAPTYPPPPSFSPVPSGAEVPESSPYPAAPPRPPAPVQPPAAVPAPAPDPTRWAAPGGTADSDRESP